MIRWLAPVVALFAAWHRTGITSESSSVTGPASETSASSIPGSQPDYPVLTTAMSEAGIPCRGKWAENRATLYTFRKTVAPVVLEEEPSLDEVGTCVRQLLLDLLASYPPLADVEPSVREQVVKAAISAAAPTEAAVPPAAAVPAESSE